MDGRKVLQGVLPIFQLIVVVLPLSLHSENRGLIPGGSAEATNLIFPGDRIVSVGDHDLHGCSLDETVRMI